MAAYNSHVITERIADYISSAGRGSQTRLARAMGVTPQTVNKWVKGHIIPEPDRWRDLEAAIGLDAGTLAVESGFGAINRSSEIAELRAEVERLRQIVERLDSGSRARR